MAYNFAAAFLPAPKIHGKSILAPFYPPFEGDVKGFNPKIEIVSNPVNIGKANTQLLDLRAKWLNAFLTNLEIINPEIPREVAIEWVNIFMPKTWIHLADSINIGEPMQLAERLADAWKAA